MQIYGYINKCIYGHNLICYVFIYYINIWIYLWINIHSVKEILIFTALKWNTVDHWFIITSQHNYATAWSAQLWSFILDFKLYFSAVKYYILTINYADIPCLLCYQLQILPTSDPKCKVWIHIDSSQKYYLLYLILQDTTSFYIHHVEAEDEEVEAVSFVEQVFNCCTISECRFHLLT